MGDIVRRFALRSFIHRSSSYNLLMSVTGTSQFQTASSANVHSISDNLSFRQAVSSAHTPTSSAHSRPIVLIYAWLAAKSRHIHKFGDFYLGKGFDVLHIKVNPSQVLWPHHAHSVVRQIIDFVTSPGHASQPILVHGFSVGGYLYGETLIHIMSDSQLTQQMSRRIRGQVFDSPVDFDGVPRGVGNAVSNLWPVQLAIRSCLETYMLLFHQQVTVHYHQSSRTFRDNPLCTTSLVLYSHADTVATTRPIETLIDSWRSRGALVYTHCWSKSRHVEHYLNDPVNYMRLVNEFIDMLGLEQHSTDTQHKLVSKL